METYNPVTHSVDSHFEDFSKEKKIQNQNILVFMQNIFYGVERYSSLMKVRIT
jgi:hypothetical protein